MFQTRNPQLALGLVDYSGPGKLTPPRGTMWCRIGVLDRPVPFKHRFDLERHFARHGQEFLAETADEYERLADVFMTGTLRAGASECFRSNGDLVRFDPRTDEFGVRSVVGLICTYMIVRPLPHHGQTSLQYFQSNCRQ